jgi:hypothetical protein
MSVRFVDDLQLSGSPTIQGNRSIGERIPAQTEQNRVSYVRKTYTMLGTEAAADTVKICRMAAGCVILPHASMVSSSGCAATLTLDVGDDDVAGVGAAVDADRYADGLNVAAAGEDLFSANACAALRTPYVLGADSWIIGLFATLSTPTAAGKLRFLIAFLGA